MGRLTKELERQVESFYSERSGLLIAVNDNFSEICDASRRISEFCDTCKYRCNDCFAGCPVISLGEIDPNLVGSKLSAVGLLDIENPSVCEIVRRREKWEI